MESNEERRYKYYPKKRFYLRMGKISLSLILLDEYYTGILTEDIFRATKREYKTW